MRHALVTGGAGFIGSHLVDRLLVDGWRVTCVDDFDPFYDRALKESNIQAACDCRGYRLVEEDIRNLSGMRARLREDYDVVFHLAAKAGVRPSIEDPITYQQVDLGGTQNILEFAKERGIKEVIFASSSSVYGAKIPLTCCRSVRTLRRKLRPNFWVTSILISTVSALSPCASSLSTALVNGRIWPSVSSPG